MKTRNIVWLSAALLVSACGGNDMEPPEARKQPVELETHGDVRIDEYFWLRERDNPEVIRYLEDENAYTERMLEDASGLFERLVAEMQGRIREQDASAPYRHGDYFYYVRYEEGQEYPIYNRRKGFLDAPEEVLLDVNVEADDQTYFALRGFQVSPDHSLASYAVDTVGRRFYDIHFIDLESGEKLPHVIEQVTGNLVWANDNRTVFFTEQDRETLRWNRVFRFDIETGERELVFEETDETFGVWVADTLTGKHLFVMSSSTLATEVSYLDASKPDGELRVFLPREEEHEYFVFDGGDRFFILSNDAATNFQLFETPLDDTRRQSWQTVVPHREDVLIQNAEIFIDHIVLETRRDGLSRLEVLGRTSNELHEIDFGEPVFEASLGDNYDYAAAVVRYDYESLTTPESVYDYDLATRERTLVKEKEVLGGFDRTDYVAERRFATARDGTRVPVSMVYRKGTQPTGENPLLLYGYGSYGSSIDPGFDANRLSLLDRGFIYAIAHVRGGAEMGRDWYYDGRQLNKMNTFTDFIDVSKFLIDEGYTSADHLYARGGSAGGLLMGAIANMAPELYNGISTRVPFVDVVTTMLDASIPLTAGEWDEWGDPREKEFYDYMLSYSPYDQVTAQDYPNILVTTGLHDSQVQYWEPAKWVAKLRANKTDDNLLLLKTDMAAGHSGKTGRFQRLEDAALYYAFFLHLEGINE
jgi:oligopeptidase B